MPELRIPLSTYRVQLNRAFTFNDARALVPYLARLGITDFYSSPILKARKGSNHGYDVADPARLNPELGSEADFSALAEELKKHDMGWLLDTVPNHLAASPENPYWMDLLENGRQSLYADFFDIDWTGRPGSPQGKILLPVLGRPYPKALAGGELKLELEHEGLFLRYHDFRLPVGLKSAVNVLSHDIDRTGHERVASAALQGLIDLIRQLPARRETDPGKRRELARRRNEVKEEVWRTVRDSPALTEFVRENIGTINGGNRKLLDALIRKQAYHLTSWKAAHDRINYRRFFDVNELIGIREEDIGAFELMQSLTLRLIKENKITGLRIDHIDGLYDPLHYLLRFRNYLAPEPSSREFYVVVEKILEGDETFPAEWPVYGTTGYDFLNRLNAIFIDPDGLNRLGQIYIKFTGLAGSFAGVAYEKKRMVLRRLFTGEIAALGRRLAGLAGTIFGKHIPPREVTLALIDFTAGLPVYRTYIHSLSISHADRYYLEQAYSAAMARSSDKNSEYLDLLKRAFQSDFPASVGADIQYEWLHTVMRWQQLTGAAMAKGFEDTALYNYNRLISINDVGACPGETKTGPAELHAKNGLRQTHFPHTMNATATHDTKRGEDVRARINVLSEIPGEWEERLNCWRQLNEPGKTRPGRRLFPDPNTGLFFYQTLLGAYPLSGDELPAFRKRIKEYMIKAVREAKAHTSWTAPDEGYEKGLLGFIDAALDESVSAGFLDDFRNFEEKVAFFGAINSLSQLLIKIASPGNPDFYQGTEFWDLSLVDPDNRRPVDFGTRRKTLEEIIRRDAADQDGLISELVSTWPDGRIKLYVTWKALNFRRDHPGVFRDGAYRPLEAAGERSQNVFAFMRRDNSGPHVIAAAPRLTAGITQAGRFPLGETTWHDSGLLLPEDSPPEWRDVLTGNILRVQNSRELPLARIFHRLPVALLESQL